MLQLNQLNVTGNARQIYRIKLKKNYVYECKQILYCGGVNICIFIYIAFYLKLQPSLRSKVNKNSNTTNQ